MTLRIISANEIVFDGRVQLVSLPGVEGSFTVLKDHASLISVLAPGKVRYINADDSSEHTIEVSGGLADVDNNVVSVCIY